MVRFDYGIVLLESLKKRRGFVDVKSVAQKNNLSVTLMEKVAQDFKHAGFIDARRGFGGGYRLIKEISVSELIIYFDRRYKLCPLVRKI